MTNTRPVTVPDLRQMKADGRKITMLTAYDAVFARLLDEAGVDVVLVGDSLGMVVQGHKNTLPVTIGHMAYHGAAVSRVVERAHVVVDMPFLSYHISTEEAVRNAGLLIQSGGHSVKLEGGAERADTIRAIVTAQIPVMGHIGLTPQSFHTQGGFKVQGRDEAAAQRIIDDALAVQAAGAYSLVLEGIPAELAAEISARLDIPTIGIGAGSGCDGQVLVIYDLLGMDRSFKPKFVKRYAQLHDVITGAIGGFIDEVRSGAFPDAAHSFHGKKAAATGLGSSANTAPATGPAAPRLRAVYGPSEG